MEKTNGKKSANMNYDQENILVISNPRRFDKNI